MIYRESAIKPIWEVFFFIFYLFTTLFKSIMRIITALLLLWLDFYFGFESEDWVLLGKDILLTWTFCLQLCLLSLS
jgi:hypothetical protein